MSKFEVKVHGIKPPKRPDGAIKLISRRVGGAIKAVLIRPRRIVLTGIASFLVFVGTPHAGWDYQCSQTTRGFGSCNSVSWCACYRIQGRRVVSPQYGERCQLVTFLPMDWNKLIEGVFG